MHAATYTTVPTAVRVCRRLLATGAILACVNTPLLPLLPRAVLGCAILLALSPGCTTAPAPLDSAGEDGVADVAPAGIMRDAAGFRAY